MVHTSRGVHSAEVVLVAVSSWSGVAIVHTVITPGVCAHGGEAMRVSGGDKERIRLTAQRISSWQVAADLESKARMRGLLAAFDFKNGNEGWCLAT